MFLGRALWTGIVIVLFLTGYSFIQALTLYSEVSRSALKLPELARGLSPLDGIFVPTFGALYLAATFLYPFVVIRMVGAEKQSGALKMLIQLPYPMPVLIAAKLTAGVAAWMFMLLPCMSALCFWWAVGGHISAFEVTNLILGHFLYAMVIAGISLVAASVSEDTASAAIATLGVTIGFWVLDFASAGDDGLLRSLSELSLTSVLRTFERGVFSLGTAVSSLLAVLCFTTLTGIWIHPGRSALYRWGRTTVVIIMAAIAITAAAQVKLFCDATEERRNSFSVTDEVMLSSMREQLYIGVHLTPEDPRLYDLQRSILDKLKMIMQNVKIAFADVGMNRALTGSGDQYGQIVYRYNGREAMSRSTSEKEVLPLIFEIAGLKRPIAEETDTYSGYPLIVDTRWAKLWFYVLLPLAVLFFWYRTHCGTGIIRKNITKGEIL